MHHVCSGPAVPQKPLQKRKASRSVISERMVRTQPAPHAGEIMTGVLTCGDISDSMRGQHERQQDGLFLTIFRLHLKTKQSTHI